MSSIPVATCMLCGAPGVATYSGLFDHLFGAPGAWNFNRCPRDGLLWLTPQPTEKAIRELYLDYYTHRPPGNVGRLVPFGWRNLSAGVLAELGYRPERGRGWPRWITRRVWRPVKDRIEAAVMWLPRRPGSMLLDVGCGDGRFLLRMSNAGWRVFGVEPDREAAERARARLGTEI